MSFIEVRNLTLAAMFFVIGASAAASERVTIPSGGFYFGCSMGDADCQADEGPPGGIYLEIPAFSIDTHEASVAEYRECVAQGFCSKPFDVFRTHYCNYDAPRREDYPVNCVNWHQAREYCAWRGARLAYAVEWEKAARAGSRARFPWGDAPVNCARAVMDPGGPGDLDTETDGCYRDLSWPRGSFAPNAHGLFDMVGGTSEWVMDWYGGEDHTSHYSQDSLLGPEEGERKVIRGGSWDERSRAHRVSNNYAKPMEGNPDLYGSNGIRCVHPLPESLGNQD